jgi:hypothetical protein
MKKISALIILVILLIAPSLWAENSEVLKPVQIFIEHYGKDMEKVADITTLEFRDGKSKLEWAAFTGKMLESFGYERLQSDIKQTVRHDDLAYVHVRARVDTVAASAEHDELYRVIRDGDVWKIDALEVVNEDIEARLRQL